MITNNLAEYILQHSDEESAVLARINRDTNVLTLNPHMLSGHLQGRLLSMISHMIQPQHILELGTFTGYSALCLAEGLQPNGLLDTVEVNDELEDMIRANLAASPLGEKICLHIGDALQVLENLHKTYDLAFIDADKRDYCAYYDAVFEKVKSGGFILADNTLWAEKILDTKNLRDKQTAGIARFNDYVAADKRVEKLLLPLRDGLTLIRKK